MTRADEENVGAVARMPARDMKSPHAVPPAVLQGREASTTTG